MTSATAVYRVADRGVSLASVRYRGLLPACALQSLGWQVGLSTGAEDCPPAADIAFAVKPLTQREANWVECADAAGVPVVVDLCDNIFVENYAGEGQRIAERFLATARDRVITVPTAGLGEIVRSHVGADKGQILVVPDIVETPALLGRQRRLVGQRNGMFADAVAFTSRQVMALRRRRPGRRPRLLWFGNHGATTYASFGLSDLMLFSAALARASRQYGAELWVVSNHRERFERIAGGLPIRSRYFEWSPNLVDALLPAVDDCLVPNSGDAFSRIKSANRALKALAAGVPVVGTSIDAYYGMEGAVWLDDPADGIQAYLDDRRLRRAHLRAARAIVERDYSPAALQLALSRVVDAAMRARCMA